jgi:hypothetical protein
MRGHLCPSSLSSRVSTICPWILASLALTAVLLGVSEPALAQVTPSPPCASGSNGSCPAGNYPNGIGVGPGGNTLTLAPGVSVGTFTPASPATLPIAVSIDNTSGGPGDGAPGTLFAPSVTINMTNNPPPGSFTSALFLHTHGDATIGTLANPVSGIMNVNGGPNTNTNAIWATTFTTNATPVVNASVTYNGPSITATGGSNSTIIQACVNVSCGFTDYGALTPGVGNATINAAGNLTGVFVGFQSVGLDAVAAGDSTAATVNYNSGTINLMGGDFSDGIFASAGGPATVTTLNGTTIIVSATGAAPDGVEAFSDNGPATATVASTILINGNPAVPTTNYKSSPTGIRVQSDLGGDASVTYSGPSIEVHGGGGIGIIALSGSSDNTTASGSVAVNASAGPIIADGSNAVGIIADSGFIRNVFRVWTHKVVDVSEGL